MKEKGFAPIIILVGVLIIVGLFGGAWYTKTIQIPNLPPPGCHYQQVECFQAPCNPILVCGTSSPTVVTSAPQPTASLSPADETNSKYDKLISKVKSKGLIRVIVNLNVPEQSEKQVIADTQDKLLKELSTYNVSSVKKFQYTPAIVLEVDNRTLNFLISSPDVKNIQEDRASPPAN